MRQDLFPKKINFTVSEINPFVVLADGF